jgi:hypothetical protein
MRPQCTWIADFVAHALLRKLCDDADWIADAAGELYGEMSNVDARLAAEAAFAARPMSARVTSAEVACLQQGPRTLH